MAGKDLRKEQVELLRLEKDIKKIATKVAALTTAGGVASLGLAHAEVDALKTSIVDVAEKTSKLHAQAEQIALEQGVRIMQAGGGSKSDPPAVVEIFKSILGLG